MASSARGATAEQIVIYLQQRCDTFAKNAGKLFADAGREDAVETHTSVPDEEKLLFIKCGNANR